MRTWDERDSLLRKTTRKIKEMEIPEKCRDGYAKATELGREYKDKASDFARGTAEKIKNANFDKKILSFVDSIKDWASFGFRGSFHLREKLERLRTRICDWFFFAGKKIKEKNLIALAICAGLAVLAVFGIFYSVFYTIFSLKKRR